MLFRSAALAGVTGRDAGLASGLINTSQQIGGALGLAILTTVFSTRANNLIADGKPRLEALTEGFSLAFWVAMGVSVAAMLTTLFWLTRKELAEVEHEGATAPAG